MSEYILKHTGKELDMAIEKVLNGCIDLSSLLNHCTRYANGSYTPASDVEMSDVRIPISEGGVPLKPKIFSIFHFTKVDNTDTSMTKFAVTASVTVSGDDGAVLYAHTCGVFYDEQLKACSGQSTSRYFKPDDTGVVGTGPAAFYMRSGKRYLWHAWG